MAKMVEITCACGCRRKKMVRQSDIKRGWGKYFSKSCKAKDQERRTGQYAAYQDRQKNNQLNRQIYGGMTGWFGSYSDECDYDFSPGD